MSNEPSPDTARTAIVQASRSSVGRATGAISRLLGGVSTIQATGRFLRRQLWAWPLVAAIVLGGVGWWVNHSVESALHEQRVAELNTMVEASVSAVRVWTAEQKNNLLLVADDEQLRTPIAELLRLAEGPSPERKLVLAEAQAALRARLMPRLRRCGYVGFFVVSPRGVVVAADQDAAVGNTLAGYRKEFFDMALAGTTLVSRPYRSPLLLADEKGELRANLPSMFVTGPLRDKGGRVVAALGLRIRPEDEFTRILQVVRFGESGETYAFDKKGLLLSESRFDDELKQLGLLVDQPEARSILTVELRDPEADLTRGERPRVRRSEQPLTHLAAGAVTGEDGHDATGHRDYRGVPSVGAWRWLPEYGFAIANEVDSAEAFRPVVILRRAIWVLIALLALAAVGIFVAMLFLARQQRALQLATLTARQLGQYALEEKLGAGGMGTVYKARHALLRRPAAVKLLDVDKTSEAAITRFEREVQLTAVLTHPNTVAVFDYGRTPEGIFYYAMEYLEGMNLDELVRRHGPLSDARAVYLLRQACGSLAEAHAAGLIHRDVKPANILLTRRGGLHDFVKVLDFGLAKSLDSSDKAGVTSPNALMGTPLYLAPESINQPDQVDVRADIYALAAVGYFLLTGTPIFSGSTIMEICLKHVKEAPEPPSARRGKAVSPDLEALLLRCLSKSPAERPADASEMLRELEECVVEGTWTARDAAAWWVAIAKETVTPASRGQTGQAQPTAGTERTMAYEKPAEKA